MRKKLKTKSQFWFFGLLSSSLLWRIENVSAAVSSSIPCLSGHRSDSTGGGGKSFLCPDKQGTPEEGLRIQQLKH